ncbi:Glycerol-3-phosphate acyltransferase [bioreactor metagenome]|uniref:Glycerol-3-phosphate acyltransferase n=1 Tax=bioreactor metagenome TaxID=1076179 RepID=A0A645C0M4_9ZZZZ
MIFVGIVITLVTNYIALATMFTVIAYPVHFWFAHLRPDMVILLTGLAIIIIYKHRTNIINIIKGKEIGLRPKVSQR